MPQDSNCPYFQKVYQHKLNNIYSITHKNNFGLKLTNKFIDFLTKKINITIFQMIFIVLINIKIIFLTNLLKLY